MAILVVLQSSYMDQTRIAALLAPFIGDFDNEKLLADISTYIDILLRWNSRLNLTAIRDPEEIATRHFGESLFAARVLLSKLSAHSASSAVKSFAVADVGSGAGFPGIPFKLWAPQISLTLVESNHKKATFLREIARSLTLTNIDVQNVRAESLQPRAYDLVSLRAVERFESALPAAAALVKPEGRLALLIGSAQVDRTQVLLPDWSWSRPIPIPLSHSRILLAACPSPRREHNQL